MTHVQNNNSVVLEFLALYINLDNLINPLIRRDIERVFLCHFLAEEPIRTQLVRLIMGMLPLHRVPAFIWLDSSRSSASIKDEE